MAALALMIAATTNLTSSRTAVDLAHDASTARADALSVSEFLVRMLERAVPIQESHAQAMLEAAESDFARTFAGHPHAEARVRMAFGRTYKKLGDVPRAARHFERAADLIRGLPDFHPGSLRYCQQELAAMRGARGA